MIAGSAETSAQTPTENSWQPSPKICEFAVDSVYAFIVPYGHIKMRTKMNMLFMKRKKRTKADEKWILSKSAFSAVFSTAAVTEPAVCMVWLVENLALKFAS